MKIQLLGTRGSCATCNQETQVFGGDTSCVKVMQGDNIIYIDAGTGLISECNLPIDNAVVLLSHYHLDHICALALFASRCKSLTIFAPQYNGKNCEEVFESLFSPPLWPIGIKAVCDVAFNTVLPNSNFNVNGFEISCAPLCHPNGAIGYRITSGDKTFCYLCDHEHDILSDKSKIEAFVKNADLLIADAPYTAEEYLKCKGYGHSSNHSIIDLVQKAHIKKALLTHHSPYAKDKNILALNNELTEQYSELSYAKQGEMILL